MSLVATSGAPGCESREMTRSLYCGSVWLVLALKCHQLDHGLIVHLSVLLFCEAGRAGTGPDLESLCPYSVQQQAFERWVGAASKQPTGTWGTSADINGMLRISTSPPTLLLMNNQNLPAVQQSLR